MLGSQALAIGTVFHIFIGIDITPGIIIGMTFVLVYSAIGGMWAVVQTDILQFLMLGTFLPLAMIIGLYDVGGAQGLVDGLPSGHLDAFGHYDLLAFLGIFLSFLLGECLIPPYAQRAFSAPDSTHARKGYAWAGVFGFIFYFVSATLGLIALVIFPSIDSDQALPLIVRELLPVGVAGLVAASLLAVVMSTADSLLNSAAVVFTKDIYKPFIHPSVSHRGMLWLERAVTITVGTGALLFAISAEGIIQALLYAYALWAPTVVLPFIFAVVTRRRAPRAAIAAIFAGGLTAGIWTWGVDEPFGVTGPMMGLVANIAVFSAVLLTADRRYGKISLETLEVSS